MAVSLASKVLKLDDVAPVDIDPEDFGSKEAFAASDASDEEVGEDGAATAHYVDVGPSNLRRQAQADFSDPKYDGVTTSRRQLVAESGSDYDIEEEENDEEEEITSNEESASVEKSPSPRNNHEDAGDRADEESPDYDMENLNSLATSLRRTRDAELVKGKAVTRQLALCDAILDARIRIQGALLALKPPSDEVRKNAVKEAVLLVEEIEQLQEALIAAEDIELSLPPKKRQKNNEGSDLVQDIQDLTYGAHVFEAAYHPHLVSTLRKWSNKIQVVAPSTLLPKQSAAKAFLPQKHQNPLDAVQIIGQMLVSSSLKQPTTTYDTCLEREERFYRTLLRDVIESRTTEIGAPLAEEEAALRKKKKKKGNVDTKASKGRKLRYEVHDKLQHFMVPVPSNSGWHSEQIDELFASVLGSSGGIDASRADTEQEALNEAADLTDGFRVFG